MDTPWALCSKGAQEREHYRNVVFGSALVLSFREVENGVHVILPEIEAKI